jgi:hypothetical protein
MAPKTAVIVKKGKRNHADHAKEDSNLLFSQSWPLTTSRREAAAELSRCRSRAKNDNDNNDIIPLPPGPRLHACSGRDIQVSRGAMTRPNIDKGKGRFLIVLPGLLSLRSGVNDSNSGRPSLSSVSDKNNNNINTNDSMEAEHDAFALQTDCATAVVNPTPPSPTTIGRIDQLASDAPILKIPWQGSRTLCFPGRKVPTSSEFMVLTCKSKGSVMCKVSAIYVTSSCF